MIIKTLIENTSLSENYASEHGLSLYIETKNHKLLFDTGASSLFLENAKKMGVNISEIDLVVISHGHYDHGGGLKEFLKLNSIAEIFINQKAFDKHIANRPGGEKAYIGLDRGLLSCDRFVFVGDSIVIDNELQLISNVKGDKLISLGNQDLFMESEVGLVKDNFEHEQNLIIKEDAKTVLVAGCAHNGIVNIIEYIVATENIQISHVIGGFHLYNRLTKKSEASELISQLGDYLKNTSFKYYTCHCTGIESYKRLKEIMEEKIQYLSTGSQITI